MTDKTKVIEALECRKKQSKSCGELPCRTYKNCPYARRVVLGDREFYTHDGKLIEKSYDVSDDVLCDTDAIMEDALSVLERMEQGGEA